MQSLQDDHLKTKSALKKKEKNIDSITEKLYRQQALLSRMFNELKINKQYNSRQDSNINLDMFENDLRHLMII